MGISGLSCIRPLDVNLHDRHLIYRFQRRQQSVHIAYRTRASHIPHPTCGLLANLCRRRERTAPAWKQTSVYEIVVDGVNVSLLSMFFRRQLY